MLFSVHRSLVLLLLLTLFLRQKAKNLRAPPLAACFQELSGDSPGSTDNPNVFYQCIDGDWCSTFNATFQSVLRNCFACQNRYFQRLGVVTDM